MTGQVGATSETLLGMLSQNEASTVQKLTERPVHVGGGGERPTLRSALLHFELPQLPPRFAQGRLQRSVSNLLHVLRQQRSAGFWEQAKSIRCAALVRVLMLCRW